MAQCSRNRLLSALAFHGLTDQLPRKVWFAIGAKDWEPSIAYPPVRVVRFREPSFSDGIETNRIGGTQVRIYSAPKSIADSFRHPKLVDRSVAIEAQGGPGSTQGHASCPDASRCGL